jgi:hypothetical protein
VEFVSTSWFLVTLINCDVFIIAPRLSLTYTKINRGSEILLDWANLVVKLFVSWKSVKNLALIFVGSSTSYLYWEIFE